MLNYEFILNEDTKSVSDTDLEESVELDYHNVLNESTEQIPDNEFKESVMLDYEYVLKESSMLNEVSVTTFSAYISSNLQKGTPAKQAGSAYGAKFAEHADTNTLQPRSIVTKDPSMHNANIDHFSKYRPDINTKLIETMYTDTCGQLRNNQQYVREFFESFVAEVKAKTKDIPFAPSEILNIA